MAFYHACMGLACPRHDITADVHVLIRQTYISDMAYCKDCPHGAGRKEEKERCKCNETDSNE
jgi:uncharacterized hydantoinase/oxoprolinase family protein